MLSRIILVLLLLSAFGAHAQSVVTLVSSETKQPLVQVPVVVRDSSSAVIFSTRTDNRGNTVLPQTAFIAGQPGHFQLEAEGYEPKLFVLKNGETKTINCNKTASDIGEVVITGQLSDRSSDQSVQKARVIDRATIDAKGAVNLRDVLQSELNIRISQDNVLGSGISLQGMSGQNVKILIDGVPVIGRVDGEIDLSQINLSNIERIEIIEGPSSVSYGSNALAGTINLISKKRERQGQHLGLNTYVESVGNYNIDGRFTTNIRKTQLQLTGQRNYFDGWIDGDPFCEFPKEKMADSGRYQTWKPKIQYQAGARWIVPFKRVLLTPYADYFYEQIHNKGLPRAPYFNTAFDDYYTTYRTDFGTMFDAAIGTKYRIRGVVARNDYQRIKNTYIKNLNTLAQQLTTTEGDQDTTQFTAIMSRASFVKNEPDSAFNYEIGYDFNSETAYGRRILASKQTITEIAAFSNAEWTIKKKFIIRPGVRYTWNSGYRSSLTPALNLKYGLPKWTFRASAASGFRSPAIKELYLDFVDVNHNIKGNTDLKPEQSMHYQGWISTKRTVNGYPLLIDLSGYYQHVNDRITLAQDGTGVQYSYFNLDKFDAVGTQASVDFRPGKHHFKLGFSYIGTKSNLTINGYAFSPEITFNTGVLWKKPAIMISAFYKYTGRVQTYLMLSDDPSPTVSYINDYSMLDLNLTRDFFKKLLTVSVGGKNLLDVKQVAAGSGPGVHGGSGTSAPVSYGRTVYMRLQFNFHYKK